MSSPDARAAPGDAPAGDAAGRGLDRPLVLVGLMAAGKTSVARRLATALGRPFRDSDRDLEQRYGSSAAEQYGRHGVELLHEREAAVLRAALAARPAPVIAAAASVVDDPACRAALAGPDAFVVWLDAPPEVLATRIGTGDHRPHYHPDPEAMLAAQYAQRAGRFRSVSDLRVEVGGATPAEAASAVLAALAGTPAPDSGTRAPDPGPSGPAPSGPAPSGPAPSGPSAGRPRSASD